MSKDLIHGAKWWKFDFHNHTPMSNDFGKGDELHTAISPEDWLLMYMNAGLDCIAITDHNSGEWIDVLKIALAGMEISQPNGYRKLYLFPGVEISASGNIHVLALFDPSAGTKEVHALLGAVKFPAEHFGTSDAVSPKSVEEIINEIHKAGGIAIPAHVDEASGLFTLTGNTLTQALKTDGLLAIEVINKAKDKPDLYKQSKLQLTEVIGSDSHIAAQVGINYTWVKMSVPSLGALKLALHDGEDGIYRKDEIAFDPNAINNRYFIKSISVADGFKAGNGTPLNAKFSPWLSTIIGGRGSGKSTIINYLRIAFARTAEMPEEVQTEFDKFNQIGRKNSTGMLREGTTITVEIFKDGKLQLISWNQQTHTMQTWDDATGNWNASNIVSNISELFPIQIFSQKELYALTDNPSKLIELIDSQFDKQSWTEVKEKLIEKWLAESAKQRTLTTAIADEQNIKAQLDSTNNKITLYESSDYKDTLSNFNTLSATNKFFTDTNNSVTQFISELENVEKSVPNIEVPEEIKDAVDEETSKFLLALNTALANVKQKLTEAITQTAPYKENLHTQFNALPWFAEFDKAKQAYEAIVDKIKELGSESYEILIHRRSSLNEKLALIATQKQELQTLQQQLQILYTSIIVKEKELRTKRTEIINRWKDLDNSENPFLIIELHPMADAENANASFRQLLRKPGSEFADYIYGYNEEEETSWGLIANIIKEQETTRWDKRLEKLNEFVSATEADKKGLDVRLARHIQWLKDNTPEDIDRLQVWVPEDKLVLKFKKQDKIEDIQTGSAGERTAGMLGLLLVLNNIPLIIDQPEDDLDSRLISSFVVPGFKNLKKNRQLIIVTHNPNIAVNANSDNIIHMNFVTGQIVVAGNDALQDKEIRQAVCDVMEGGREALNKRYFRISKALK